MVMMFQFLWSNLVCQKRVFIAGHNGMVGSALLRQLSKRDDIEIICRGRKELDLLDFNSVEAFFSSIKLMRYT